MKVSKKDKEILKGFGYIEDDIDQIGEAMTKTIYTLCKDNGEEERISRLTAREILGDEEYLSGIGRSAFHWSSMRGEGDNKVRFDSSRLFE